MVNIGIPKDLTQQHFVALCADLRGSSKTEEGKRDYDASVKRFQEVAKKVVSEHGRCIYQDISFEGETLKVLFFNPWPNVAAASAIYCALHLHKAVVEAKFNSHGVSVALDGVSMVLNGASTVSDAFIDAKYLCDNIGEYYKAPPYDSKFLITEAAFNLLFPHHQALFRNIGEKNIAKRAADPERPRTLFEFTMNGNDTLMTELTEFFRFGLIAILLEGLWPKISNRSAGNPQFLKYLINNATSEIKILQTYIPGMEVIKDNIKEALDRDVEIQVLLLKQKWKVSEEIKDLFKDIIKPEANGLFDSPLSYQRGKDFNYKRPLQFSSEINTCAVALDSLKENLCRYYDATPSACLHIIDNLMFIGHFLQGSFAVATPHFVLTRGCDLFDRFNQEFDKLWTSEH